MKSKIILIGVIGSILISACAAPTAAVEEVSAPEVETVMDEPSDQTPPEQDVDNTETTGDALTEVSFSQDVWPILEKYALAAHGGKGGVFLENYSDILGNVVPGNPEESLLYKALIGDGMKQMPPDNPLPDEMISTIYDWILQGAKDN